MFVGISVFTQILIFFALPETRWPRSANSARGLVVPTTIVGSEKTNNDEEKRDASGEVMDAKQTDIVHLVGHGAPSRKQRYSLIPTVDRTYNPLTQLKNVAVLCFYAPVLFTNLWWLAVGGASVGFGFVTSSIWYAPPYLFTPGQVGLTALPSVRASFLAIHDRVSPR